MSNPSNPFRSDDEARRSREERDADRALASREKLAALPRRRRRRPFHDLRLVALALFLLGGAIYGIAQRLLEH